MSSTALPFPAGPLNEPDGETVAVRVALEVRLSGTVDVLVQTEDVDRYGSVDALVQRWREDLAQKLFEQGGMSEDDVEIEDVDRWDPAAQRWNTVEAGE